MVTRKQVVAGVLVLGAAAVGTARILVPRQFVAALDSLRQTGQTVPRPVLLAGVGLLAVVLWLVGMWLTARIWFRVWQWVWPRYKRVAGIVLPDSPLVQFATGVMLLLAVVILLVGALPSLVGDVGTSTEDVTDPAENLNGQGFGGQPLTSDWESNLDGDGIERTTETDHQRVKGPDRDGDGLPDRWERAGETPGGAELPDADPDHKDLYVQVNYGEGVDPLTESEREQLREIWAEMAVENPDGESGIDIHVVDNGSVGDDAVFDDSDEYDRYYTESHLGNRYEVYHQVVYGRLQLGDTVGYASVPGYTGIVEGRRADSYDTTYSPRVGVTTHELLHNVVGTVDGRTHTSDGWLASGSTDEYLSGPTARGLNTSGLYGPVR